MSSAEMRSHTREGALILYDRVLIQRGNLDTETPSRRPPCKDGGRNWGGDSTSQECQRLSVNLRQLGQVTDQAVPHRNQPCSVTLHSQIPVCRTLGLLSKPFSRWYFVTVVLQMNPSARPFVLGETL